MRELTRNGRYINSRIGKAIDTYGLISGGDRILVAVSGGKDSMTLLTLMQERLRWIPVAYDLIACHVRTDLRCGDCADTDRLAAYFRSIGVEHVFRDVKVLDAQGRTDCFWCSWNRRKALFEAAEELGCNKIALGHHKDDIVETVLLNMFYKGETSAMNPRQELFGGKITIIRPLCLVEEDQIRSFAAESGLTAAGAPCQCPFGSTSKRKYVKDIIRRIGEDSPAINIKTNIYNSVARVKDGYVQLEGIA